MLCNKRTLIVIFSLWFSLSLSFPISFSLCFVRFNWFVWQDNKHNTKFNFLLSLSPTKIRIPFSRTSIHQILYLCICEHRPRSVRATTIFESYPDIYPHRKHYNFPGNRNFPKRGFYCLFFTLLYFTPYTLLKLSTPFRKKSVQSFQ